MGEHYFSGTPAAADRRREVTATIWDRRLTFQTSAGVFAREGLDKATETLLRHSEPPTGEATVLDLGCGWGAIACALAAANPRARVFAVDVNERALALCAENAERNGLRVETYRPETVPAELRFDAIWSNPPIRIGKKALHTLLLSWLDRLSPAGEARLVVGKNLGADSLQRWLTEQGWPAERIASAKGFRVLVVRRA